MNGLADAFAAAGAMIVRADPAFVEVVTLSLRVSTSATAVAALLGLPLGAALAMQRFPGRGALVAVINALMGLPPVVVGLLVYLLLSRAGPLGTLGWLFTPAAMVLAQSILLTPIVAALSRELLEPAWLEYRDLLTMLGASPLQRIATLLWDLRLALVTVVLAAFGRAAAEVGAVMIVGGNIAGHTRTMTTAIALETSKGDLPLALGLGLVLVGLVMLVNAAAWGLRTGARRRLG